MEAVSATAWIFILSKLLNGKKAEGLISCCFGLDFFSLPFLFFLLPFYGLVFLIRISRMFSIYIDKRAGVQEPCRIKGLNKFCYQYE